ncbi:hypothetical protein FB567DRAFT_552409 [Paraphoma chrysanthemicola]|uniref:Uncharacterized protein n=1 Tax=Paraphoma chrysanthemicola TaxID=798071 RepID=A0A8K0QYT0_9PLEO|nr:hypothetical protein FB567DRAFT_552409 [Paraphoma chrysanthemicola]
MLPAARSSATVVAVFVRGHGDTVPRSSSASTGRRCAVCARGRAQSREAQRRGSIAVGGYLAEDTGPADACNEACFWHCTLPDATRKATPSQPSRVPHGAVDQDGAGVPCCVAGHSFSNLQPVSTSSSLLTSPFTSSLSLLLTTVEHGVLDLMWC